ncbi:hypothetical protein V1358_11445 [Pseudoalteromonas sp. YIC-656]|nr:hypothetical protein [Vibrio parahaemolyticus]
MIKFTLIENSLDSIEQGLQFLTKAENDKCNSAYKHALLCLFQGAELILKEVLVLIDPITIFDKNSLFKHCVSPLNPTMDELYKCKSIDIRGIGQELRKHYPEVFLNSNIKVLDRSAIERNKIQHFAIEVSPEDLTKNLIELYLKVIKPAFKIVQAGSYSVEQNGITLDTINERIFRFENSFLNVKIGDGFYIGMCPSCEEHHHFIIYEGESYPIYTYCISCDYELADINILSTEYHICPECGAPSLVYDETNQAGVCLWRKCYYCQEGGFVDMEPCDSCSGYLIEEHCENCTPEES